MPNAQIEHLEPYSFTDQEPVGLTAIDGAPSEAGAPWADVWKFQLPSGFNYLFDRSSVFSAYLTYAAEVVDAALLDDGGSIADDTIDARDAGTGDVPFVAATPVAADAYYFGYRYKFQALTIVVSTTGTESDIVWIWEYYNGSAWATLPGQSANAQSIFEDGTGNQTLTFSVPRNWVKTLVGTHSQYFVRARIVTMTTDFTVDPLATQILAHGAVPEIASSNLVRVVWSDPNEEESRRLMGQVRYQMVREFQTDSKLHRMDIADRIIVPENFFIKVQVSAQAPIDASGSYFVLNGHRTRAGIF